MARPRDPEKLIAAMRRRSKKLEAGLENDPPRRRPQLRSGGHGDAWDGAFELVLICTGNRVRSPIAEAFLGHLLADLPVELRSLGTLQLGEAPPLPEALEAAAVLGFDISGHRARAIHGQDLSGADLVIGFEQRHVAAAVVEGGALRERTFLLTELVELLPDSRMEPFGDPVERARQAVAEAHARRAESGATTAAELADPLGQDRSFYRTTVERVRNLSTRLAIGLFGEAAVRPLARPVPAESGRGSRRGSSRGR
jgi:protein-tyrosine phosphatase